MGSSTFVVVVYFLSECAQFKRHNCRVLRSEKYLSLAMRTNVADSIYVVQTENNLAKLRNRQMVPK